MSRQKYTKNDKFGRPFQVIGCKDTKGNGFSKGYVELAGKLYLLEPSKADKEGVEVWIKVTKVDKQRHNPSM